MFGERIERFDDAAQAESVLHLDLELPCDFQRADGGRWHTERLAEPDFESAGRVFLVTSRDRDDSFNFEAAVVEGNVAVFVSLNSRENDRALLDQLLAIAVAKAKAADLGS